MSGWQIDWLFANLGIIAVAPPIAAKGKHAKVEEAEQKAETILATWREQLAAAQTTKAAKKKAENKKVSRPVKDGLVSKALKRLFDVEQLLADVEAERPLGSGLALGTSAYLDSSGKVIAVNSQYAYLDNAHHEVDGVDCVHRVYVDDGAAWTTWSEGGETYKEERLQCVHAEAVKDARTGWYQLSSRHEFLCRRSGEVATYTERQAPSGRWRPQEEERPPKRSARQMMMLLAPCDAMWRKVYGLRGDCESWFSAMKTLLLDDKRAPSLDLNHQLLDVLYAGIVTNSITLFQARREGAV